MHKIVSFSAHDVRFPTSRTLAGSDAMHTKPDYSAAYVVLKTDAGDGLEGHGLAFTLGRGTEVVVAAINALAPIVMGRTLNSITAARGSFHMQFSHYDPVPSQIAQKIIQQAKDEGRIRVAEED